MTTTAKYIILAVAAMLLLPMAAGSASYTSILQTFLPSVEGFSSRPIWDVKQWSWGYGTAAGYDRNNMPAGTITRDKAMQELLKYVNEAYRTISPYVTAKLNSHEWAALLSLSYNLGPNRAIQTFIPIINTGNDNALISKMRQYVYANGVRNDGLVNRREKEIALWKGDAYHDPAGRSVFATEEILWIKPEMITDEYGN